MTANIVLMRQTPLRAIRQRAHPRTSVFYQSTVEVAGGTANGIVRNLSMNGACLSLRGALPRSGETVSFTLRHIGQVSGKIMWVKADRLGISFGQAIDTAAVIRR